MSHWAASSVLASLCSGIVEILFRPLRPSIGRPTLLETFASLICFQRASGSRAAVLCITLDSLRHANVMYCQQALTKDSARQGVTWGCTDCVPCRQGRDLLRNRSSISLQQLSPRDCKWTGVIFACVEFKTMSRHSF